ncbi:LegC family aminotransferase [Alphaproteobacteria bacterium]|nr:LegC family aminotransferase [Alphaproteobacteria bacterium]
MFKELIRFIRDTYRSEEFIPLHEPSFDGNELEYVTDTINSTFVSSIGSFVTKFEENIASYTSSPCAVSAVNGTAALHISLKLAGVLPGDLVITQPLTFVATCNAIKYCSADPIFIDVDAKTLSLSPVALERWLSENTFLDNDGFCRERRSNNIVRACVPVHTFGLPADLDGIGMVCEKWNLALVEDAAESLGSTINGKHTGTFGICGTLSFNGNKIITAGGGGMILLDNKLGQYAKHLTTTAKKPHIYEYFHDEVGFNYRLPNINAALGCAQLEGIDRFISAKRALAKRYAEHLSDGDLEFVMERPDCRSNYWLNAVVCQDLAHRDALLKETNDAGVMTRPVWTLMNELPMYQGCTSGDLKVAKYLADRLVNLPSSVVK